MWYDTLLEIAHSIWKNGLSLGTVGTLIYVVLKQRRIRTRLKRFFPFLFGDDNEVREYVGNQRLIMENQRRIMAVMGVEPACPDVVTSRTSSDLVNSRRVSSLLSSVVSLLVHAAAVRGMWSITHLKLWRMIQMKKWLKPDSLTVFGGILAAAFSRYFGFEIDPANILAAAVLLLGYFKAHELVTVVRDANGLPSSFRINSRKTIFTAVAFALVIADQAFKLNFSMELILAATAAVTGYNYLEATKDAKQAEAEGEDARQMY